MANRHMVETVFQGKSVNRSLLPNYSAREILLYAFCMAAVTDGSKSIEDLYHRLGKDYDEEIYQVDTEYEDHAESRMVVDLDNCNIYIDCYSNSAKENRSRPIMQADTLLDIMIQRPGEDSISLWNRCQIGNYKGFRCPFDMFSPEPLMRYVKKYYGWEIVGGVPELDQNDSDMELPAWIYLWEKQREGIGMPEISGDCALRKYQFSIYELFLMGIAFERDAETIAFVDLLNRILKESIDEYIERLEEEAANRSGGIYSE